MITVSELCRLLELPEENFLQNPFVSHLNGLVQDHAKSKKNPTLSPSEINHVLKENFNRWFQPKVITIAALKGGIGKTFLSTHTAVRASMYGMKVLIIDLDPEACATNSLLNEEDLEGQQKRKITILEVLKNNGSILEAITTTKYPGLYLIPSALKISKVEKVVNGKNPKTLLKKYISELQEQGGFDLIFFELPPSFSTLSSSAYLASDTIVIPCTPNIHALESVDLTIEAVMEVASEFECTPIEFKVLMNMFNPKRNASQDVLQILQDEHQDILLPMKIHDSAEILNAINAGITIFETKGQQKIRDDLDALLKHLCPLRPYMRGVASESSQNVDRTSFYFQQQHLQNNLQHHLNHESQIS